ncbi:MAG: flippase-like domain-containing protein [bacterium]|nr:flippase-like domain-containing protein [bacterium]
MKKVSIIKNHKALLNHLWKLLVLSLITWFIVTQLSKHSLADFQFVNMEPLVIALVLMLMALNWGLEARKWQILVEINSFYEAVKAVLIGLLFKQFISSLGDLSGRVSTLEGKTKVAQVGSFLINSICQTIITVVFGLIGTITLLTNQRFVDFRNLNLLILLISCCVLIASILVFKFRTRIMKTVRHWFAATKEVSTNTILQILGLSAFRYLVFFTQFYLIFRMVGLDIETWILLNGIAFIFLAKSIIPTLNLFGDIGIREFSALLFFGQFGIDASLVISATLLLWIINVFLPASLAIVFVPKLKLVHN